MRRLLLPILALLAACGPADPPPTLEAGLAALAARRYQDAERALERALPALAPGSEDWQRCVVALAAAWQHDPQLSAAHTQRAAALYEALWTHGSGERRSWAALQLARLAQLRDFPGDLPDRAAARRWYRAAIDADPDSVLASQAVAYLAGCWVEELTPQGFAAAEAVLVERLTARPEDPLAALLWMQLAELRQLYRGDLPGAIAALQQVVARGGGPPAWRWRTHWRLATLAERLGERDLAAAAYRHIAAHELRSGRADAARRRLLRLGEEPPPLPERLWALPERAP